MILTCPQCSTRYQVDGAKFPSTGRNVRCAKCGNVWHQLGPMAEPDPDAEIIVEEPPPRPAPRPTPEPVAAEPRAAAFVPGPSRQVETDVEEPPPSRPRRSWFGRIALFFGWLILVGFILGIGWTAVRFRDNVALLAPSSKSIYSAVGLPVSSRGLDFTNVAYHRTKEEGQWVLYVTGRIVNHSAHEQTLPGIHISLFDADRHQVLAWKTVAPVSTLKPGQATNFSARLGSPPDDSRTVEVRFTRAGE